MAKEIIDGKQENTISVKSRNPKIEFDELQMFFGKPYIIDLESAKGSITIIQPTIGDIVWFGEKRFYSNLSIFTTNTTSYRLMLWDNGVDWNEISDFDLFTLLFNGIDNEACSLIFRDLDFSKFKLYKKTLPLQDGEEEQKQVTVLYDDENEIEINEEVYHHVSQYLRTMFQIFPDEKITEDKMLKRMYISKDRTAMENRKNEDDSSSILPVISACINHPGFKYNLEELKNVGVAQFYDSVKRLQVYEQTTAIMHGMYAGLALGGTKGLKPDDYNFMKKI